MNGERRAVLGSQFSVLGIRFSVFGFLFSVFGFLFSVFGLWGIYFTGDSMREILQYISEHPGLLLCVKVLAAAIITALAFFSAGKAMNALEKFTREKTRWKGDEALIAFLKKPVRRLIIIIGVYFFLGYFSDILGERYLLYLNGIFYILIVSQISIILMDLVSKATRLYSQTLIEKRIISGKEDFLPLVVRVTKIIIFFIALIIVLKHFNLDVQSLVVSLGVGSLAIALAAQETLSNMIAGFAIMTDRPFRVGDRIQLASGERGDVYEIGLRSTKVMTFDHTLIIVPNAAIIKEKVINLSYPDSLVRVSVYVGVAYGADLDKAKAILVAACKSNPKVLSDPPPNAYFLGFGDSSLDLRVTCIVQDWREEWGTAEEIRLEIYRRFKEEGIEIPFPQRTLWFANQPGNGIEGERPKSDGGERRRRKKNGYDEEGE
ncbi:MAG: mechanosensitive ion channel [candidate division Zixibacteria bacterium]|nr:mechanosensitive ion channel [Candidatus Tariuqbacter arcticus]